MIGIARTSKFIHTMKKLLFKPFRAVWRWMQCLVLWWRQATCNHEWEGDELYDAQAAWFITNRPNKWPHHCTKCGVDEVHHPWK